MEFTRLAATRMYLPRWRLLTQLPEPIPSAGQYCRALFSLEDNRHKRGLISISW
jgi:hypothetical protein